VNFLRTNHDLTKVFYEQTYLPADERVGLLQRVIMFAVYVGLLLNMVYAMSDVNDGYYVDKCDNRHECHHQCTYDFYPGVDCEPTKFQTIVYEGNSYNTFYLYKRKTNTTDHYQECVDFAAENPSIRRVPRTNRQARVHTCFPYCPGNKSTENWCVAEALLCVPPSEVCEFSVQMGEVVLSGSEKAKDAVVFSPLIGLFAILATLPMQLVFELYCILLAQVKSSDKDSTWIMVRNIVLQVGLAAGVVLVLCFDGFVLMDVHSVSE
jgi:hypothetical protein